MSAVVQLECFTEVWGLVVCPKPENLNRMRLGFHSFGGFRLGVFSVGFVFQGLGSGVFRLLI